LFWKIRTCATYNLSVLFQIECGMDVRKEICKAVLWQENWSVFMQVRCTDEMKQASELRSWIEEGKKLKEI